MTEGINYGGDKRYKTMDRKYNPSLVQNARELRTNMTNEERHLWYDFLRDYPVRFSRQKVLGKYIVDFYCSSANLVVELDGSQHYELSAKEYDNARTDYLQQFGLLVLRVSNYEINSNFTGVCDKIDSLVKERTN